MVPHGILAIDKPAGITSHNVVNRARRILGIRRIGHTGTLDPLATGVLVLCLGQATRIVEYLTAATKEYRAGMVFGVTTDSEDITGHIVSATDASSLTRDELAAVLPRFRGRIRQIPPMVSAVHHEGKRLYDLARKGIEVEREAREVEIHRLDLLSFEPGREARATIEVECSTGTYVRTLAADIGEAVGAGAALESLRRTRAGSIRIDQCCCLEDLAAAAMAGTVGALIVPMRDALTEWRHVRLVQDDVDRLRHGQPVEEPGGAPVDSESVSGPTLLMDELGDEVGIGRSDGAIIRPIKIFVKSV